MSITLQVYHKLPPFARNLAATIRGYYLRSWRYDENTDDLVEKILKRDYWDAEQWNAWQEERLGYVLERAAKKVPYYRDHWAKRRRKGDRASWNYLENWPVLEKGTLRENAKRFVADDCNPGKMFCDHTSGTTGTALDLWMSEETVKYWYAMFEARWRNWYGVSRKDRWAILGGQLITPVRQRKPPFWVWNSGLNQLYMSSYHLAPDLVPAYLDALARYKIRYILGYSSAIYSLSLEMIRQNRRDIRPEVVITNAEPILDYQRASILEAFRCPVRETYGMAEMVAAAGECEAGSLHQWPDAGLVEMEGSSPNSGDLICTGLINADMPLIRYRVGDRGAFSDMECDCGRTLPLFANIEGRSDDVLFSKDGRRVGRLDPVFKIGLPIVEAQIIQNSLDRLVVKYVPAKGFSKQTMSILEKSICERMGDVKISFESVPEIPRTSRGKFRAVICNLPEGERASLDR